MQARRDHTVRVVAGYDGSAAGDLALDAAIEEARARRMPLHVVCVVEQQPPLGIDVLAGERAAEGVLRAAVARAAAVLGAGRVTDDLVVGGVAAELLARCAPGDLLVVGTHGHRPVARMLLGSVSTAVVAHAPCPVLVVRGPRLRRMGPVVVGVDGSDSSLAALRYAARAAVAHGAGLRVVLALPPVTDAAGTVTPSAEHDRAAARSRLARAVATTTAEHPGLPVEQSLVLAHPVDALLRSTRDARLAVVGSRGLGGLRSMVLGSVSRELVHRAQCPVAVVRAEDAAVPHAAAV